uniref:Uncharacterized protein n=1 Tax=Tanacetum cinerariifolium TaxID=118510 RepID=A0A699HP38_TANCI|nr:hypothetical protein [Tanacetum cinerariifolium]
MCRPIGLERSDSWDRAQGHMGWSGEVDGTVQVEVRCTGVAVGRMVFGREKRFGALFRVRLTLLVPGLLIFTFDGFGFDLWAEIVLEFGFFDKWSFNIDLFDEKLLSDPALSCGF